MKAIMCGISCSWQNNLLLNFQKHITSLLHDNYIINYLAHSIEFYHILHSVLSVEVFSHFLMIWLILNHPFLMNTVLLSKLKTYYSHYSLVYFLSFYNTFLIHPMLIFYLVYLEVHVFSVSKCQHHSLIHIMIR